MSWSNVLEILIDSLLDTAKLIPFLFLAYLLIEYLEHKATTKIHKVLCSNRAYQPAIGALFGLIPQCSFSTISASLYASGMITLGTLFAVFISTSDEFIILASSSIPTIEIATILSIKIAVALIVGYSIDRIIKPKHSHEGIHEICDSDHCHCESSNIFVSALIHVVKICLFIFIFTLAINVFIEAIGTESIVSFMNSNKVIDVLVCAIIGLIPTCASSILLTSLYVEGIVSIGALIAGLIVGAGSGTLVLLKISKKIYKPLLIILTLFIIGIVVGCFIDLTNILNFLTLN